MYAGTSHFSSRSQHPGALYRTIGVETELGNASPHGLVTMLYDGLLESLTEAISAIRARNVDLKCRALGRANRIVDEGLKCALNTNEGGRLASDLSDLYAYITLRLTHANLRSDEQAVDECKRLIQPLRDAWVAIAPQVDHTRRS
jgi:flagellar protein FliS